MPLRHLWTGVMSAGLVCRCVSYALGGRRVTFANPSPNHRLACRSSKTITRWDSILSLLQQTTESQIYGSRAAPTACNRFLCTWCRCIPHNDCRLHAALVGGWGWPSFWVLGPALFPSRHHATTRDRTRTEGACMCRLANSRSTTMPQQPENNKWLFLCCIT